jgi:hypothetical protein
MERAVVLQSFFALFTGCGLQRNSALADDLFQTNRNVEFGETGLVC